MERNQKRIERALRAAENGAALTQQLLSFSQSTVLTPEITSVQDLIAGVMTLVKKTMGADIKIEVEIGAAAENIDVDRQFFATAIYNIAQNSRDAMPEGGTFSISTSVVEIGKNPLNDVVVDAPGKYVCLDLSDTGAGIEKADVDHVFEPFFTSKEVGKGRGLGLSVVNGYVHQSHGYIVLNSTRGRGTSVQIYLPACEHQRVNLGGGEQPSGLKTLKGTSVLLVEDDTAVRETTASTLLDLGCEVYEAENAQVALTKFDRLEAEGVKIDLVFSDIALSSKGINGYDLARQILSKNSDQQILLTSGNSGSLGNIENEQEAFSSHIHFLPKPFKRSRLMATLLEIIGH